MATDFIRLTFSFIDTFFHPWQNYKHFKGIKSEKNIVYNADCPKFCDYDIYYAEKNEKAEKPMPVFVNIHGGGFVKGDKKHRVSFAEYMADKGLFVINVNYRLAPEHPFPAAIKDIFDCLSVLGGLKEKYNIDTDKVFLSGDSAGAYYATLAYTALKSETVREGLKLRQLDLNPAGLLSFSGIYDLEAAFTQKLLGLPRKLAKTLFGIDVDKKLTEVKNHEFRPYFSPIEHVNRDFGKIFVSFSTHDVFLKGQGEKLIEKLKELGLDYSADIAPRIVENHCYHLLFYKKYSKICMKKALGYIAEICGE